MSWWLRENHYIPHAREAVLAHTAEAGTPTGSIYLDPEDEAAATEAFVGALPAIPFDSAEWGDDGPADGARSIPADAVLVPPELLELAAITGGATGDEPRWLAPSPDDVADDRGPMVRPGPPSHFE